jgi:hypothetical protein
MSRGRHDLEEIKRRLAVRIDALVARWFPHAQNDGGRYWRLGSIHGEPGQSLWIWRKGKKQGEWHDGASGRGGDALALVVAAMGTDFKAALEWAAGWTGVDPVDMETPEQRRAREERWKKEQERRERQEREESERKRLAAKALFLSGAPIAGTPAEAYLLGRAIDLSKLPRSVDCLRFHDSVHTAEGDHRPALLAAVCDGAGFLTVHRHFLFRLPTGEWVKASDARVPEERRMQGKSAKQAYGPFGGGMIPVWRGAGHHSWRSKNVGDATIATEGLEDALTWACARPDMRVCAAVSLGNLGRMWLPPQIRNVLWHRHRGDGPKALALYASQAEAIAKRGIALGELWAPGDAKDVNEWAQEEARKERALA